MTKFLQLKKKTDANLGIQIQFTVINKAGRNVTISDKTGTWKMDFPVENEESQPQVTTLNIMIVYHLQCLCWSYSGVDAC